MSESYEVQQALTTVSQAIAPLKAHMPVTWILDSGFDASAVGRTIWEQEEHVVWHVKHTDRLLAFQDRAGHWHDGAITQARQHLRRLGQAETMLGVQRGRQQRPKAQRVPVELWAGPVRVRYATTVRRPGAGRRSRSSSGWSTCASPTPRWSPGCC